MEVPGRKDASLQVSSCEVMVCTPCSQDGLSVEAAGFCKTCEENMCKECLQYHRKLGLTRNHVIIYSDSADVSMETTSLSKSTRTKSSTECTEMCDVHTDEVIKHFCHDHDVVGCGSCVIDDHRNCHLDTITNTLAAQNSPTLDNTVTINGLKGHIRELEVQIQDRKMMTEDQVAVEEDIQKLHEKVKEHAVKHVNELLNRSRKLRRHNMKTVDDMVKWRKEISQQVDHLANNIDEETNNRCDMFVKNKRLSCKLGQLKTDCVKVEEDMSFNNFSFKPSAGLEELFLLESPLGHIECSLDLSAASVLSIAGKLKVGLLSQQEEEAWVTGICRLASNEILVADRENLTLKLFDGGRKKMTSRLILGNRPWDVTGLPDNQVAVTIPESKRITILTTEGGLCLVRGFIVGGECYGIAYNAGKLVVTYVKPGYIEIMGLDGTVYQVVVKANNVLLECPMHVSVRQTHDQEAFIYVSDSETNAVFKITMEGKVKAHLQDPKLCSPHGIVPIDSRHVAVCIYNRNMIALLAETETTLEIVNEFACVDYPRAIEKLDDNRLLVSSNTEGEADLYIYTFSQ